jgi:nucleoside-diphosphate-sugar epimerase
MKILITGGTGFVGVNFIPALLDKGYSVRILCRNKEKAIRLLGDKCEVFIGDVTNMNSLNGCCNGIDIVYHMVAKVGNELPSEENFASFREVNVKGVQYMINEAKRAGVKRFIFISSIAAMGVVHEKVISEKSKCNPFLPYQITKNEGEQIILNEFHNNGFPGIVVRPTKVYGYGEHEYTYLTLAKLCKKGIFPRVGNGQNYTSNIYISDLVQGLIELTDHGIIGETYILTSKNSISFAESAKIIAKEMDVKIHFIYIPIWFMVLFANIIECSFLLFGKKPPVTKRNVLATVTDRIYDISKAEKEIRYRPKITMEIGIKKVIQYYKDKDLI